ncbi:TonB-dependent receptor plug domain-containing protein [Pelagicoccus sp. SDUM812003]|uniref:TonB-dependent siderophore receptor n=1 Tax=Pelagicoccus sp. SDUM812003 TaxID=3041267 RepID=UPI00280FF7B7|nr:TonB-dependent receptor plug domain-containing protein [Pelagicoccus sp. SDUM812003]MDQ8204790.1 TonB-dependent receptor plug domain-containing protein [Pelagicoccus sp. SDUM812003]
MIRTNLSRRKQASYACLGAGVLFAATLSGQSVSTLDSEESEDDVYELTPFTVDASQDQGYRATNTISGTRLNAAIKDIPMPIEVVTEEFIKDTGSTDLRQSLAYSAGMVMTSQNDAGKGNSFGTIGGVHNPEGATSNKTQTSYKVRGFITDATLRDGYRRQFATDAANIGRVEVIRGPAALLYGIGNFGGIVNYLPKTPTEDPMQRLTLSAGNQKHYRAVFEAGDTLDNAMKLGYYVTAVHEQNGSYTELAEDERQFISPIFTFRPTEKTEVTIDMEYGLEHKNAVGFQSVRARGDLSSENVANQQDRLERAGFLQFPDKEIRTMRWSGPDTFLDTESHNIRLQATHSFSDNLNLLLGYNTSKVEFDSRDVSGGITNNVGPENLRSTITVIPASVENGDAEFVYGEVTDAIFQGSWMDKNEIIDRSQIRAELNYNFDLFENSELWSLQNSFLLGRSEEKSIKDVFTRGTIQNQYFYWDPTDSSYMRFGVNGDGTAAPGMEDVSDVHDQSWNQGTYLVYQGSWLDERLTAVAGMRRDRNDFRGMLTDFREDTVTNNDAGAKEKDTSQVGLTFALNDRISVYALKAEGIMPNFDGNRDVYGNPMDAVTAESEEAGIKFDLIEGKLSGTISAYRIKQTGTPIFYWWAPAPAKGRFDPDADIIYNVGDFNPTVEADWRNGSFTVAKPEWDAAVDSGAAYQIDGTWYLNATEAEGRAYMDRVFDASKTTNPGWPGWLYTQDDNTNNATLDFAAAEAGGYDAYLSGDQESSGWEAQFNYAPTDNMQFVLNYAQTKRSVVNAGAFPEYEWGAGGVDKWAVWYFPDGAWGLSGYSLEDQFLDPNDTSTWQGRGYGAGEKQDDTPRHALSGWGNYQIRDGQFAGLSFGLGFQYESEREYFSGITDGSGQLVTDTNGQRVVLETDTRINIDAMAKYEFTIGEDRNAHVQLNVYNVMNDQSAYGYIYAKPTTYRLQFGVDL